MPDTCFFCRHPGSMIRTSGILFSSATKGYIGVSVDNVFDSCKVSEYDPATNAWREIQKFPSGSYLNTESFRLNDRLFVVGGMYSGFSKQVWEFIP